MTQRKRKFAAPAAEGLTPEQDAQLTARSADYLNREAGYHVAELRAMGFRLLPIPAGEKFPPPAGYPTDGVDYLIPKDHNVAIDTGHFWDGSALLVLDVDVRDGKPGKQSLTALEAEHGELPKTLTTITPTGGRHLFFKVPRPVVSNAGKLGKGIDVRSKSGYVLAPGSKVAAGVYRFEGQKHAPPGSVVTVPHPPIADAPAWLVALCDEPRERIERPNEVILKGHAAEVARAKAVAYLTDEAPTAVEGAGGDATTFQVAARVRDFGVSQDECVELMLDWNERCAPPWSPDDLARKVANAYTYAKGEAGADNPAHVFSEVPADNASPDDREPRLRPVDIRDIANARIDPPRFVVEQIIPAGLVTLLGGHGGSGKSILALTIAAHVAAGTPWAGMAIDQGPALFVSLEDRGEFVRSRLQRVIRACGLDAARVERDLRIVDGTDAGPLMDEAAIGGTVKLTETATLDDLRTLVRDARLVVIDNASDAFEGNENVRRQVRRFVRTLATLGKPHGAAVLLLAHIDKNAARDGSRGNSYSGSTAWHNSVRSRIALVDSKGSAVELRHEKTNHGPFHPGVSLSWTNGVLVPASGHAANAQDDADDVLRAIEAATRDGASIPTARTGSLTAQHALERFPDLPQRLQGGAGRAAFWAAVTALQRSSRIKVEEFRNEQRKMRTRFVLAAPVCASSAPF